MIAALVLRQARHQPRRLVACGLAIVIGVAFVVAVLGMTSTVKATMTRAAAGQVAGADAVVTTSQWQLSDEQVAAASRARGAAAVQPMTTGTATARWRDGADLVTIGTAPDVERLRSMTLTAGRWPVARGEAVVDARTADRAQLAPGGSVVVDPASADDDSASGQVTSPVTVRIVGIAELGLASGLPGRVLLAPDADVRAWTGARPNALSLVAAPGTTPQQLADAVAEVMPPPAGIRTGQHEAEVRAQELTGDIDVLGAMLLAFAAIALVVAAIVIANTFAILLAQRGRELAMLRCVGATRRQVSLAVLGESGVVGVVSSLLGLGLGAGVTAGATAWSGHRWPALEPQLSLPGAGMAGAVLLGVVTTLVAAVVPARRAGRIAPLAALRPLTADSARRIGAVRAVAGLLLVGLGAAGLVPAAATGLAGLPLGLLAGATSLLGVLLAGPVIVPALVRVAGPAFSRRPTGALAVANTLRNPGRAASTVTALLLGICLITLMMVGSASVRRSADDELDRQLPVDAAVSVAPSAATGLPAGIVDQVLGLPGVQAAAPLRTVQVLAGTTGTDGGGTVAYAGDPAALAAVLRTGVAPRPGSLVASTGLIEALAWRDGATVAVRMAAATPGARPSAPVALRVVVDDRSPGLLLAAEDVQRWAPGAVTTSVWVRSAPGTDAGDFMHRLGRITREVEGAGTDVAGVSGTLEQRAMLDQVLSVMLWVVTGLLGVALLIAVVGVANTLSLSVLERTRESGVQRALGMTRGQLRLGLALEAVLLALVAGVLGVGLGIAYGWAGTHTLLAAELERITVVVPWAGLGLVVAGAVAAAVVASVLPARRAARVAPTVALAAQ